MLEKLRPILDRRRLIPGGDRGARPYGPGGAVGGGQRHRPGGAVHRPRRFRRLPWRRHGRRFPRRRLCRRVQRRRWERQFLELRSGPDPSFRLVAGGFSRATLLSRCRTCRPTPFRSSLTIQAQSPPDGDRRLLPPRLCLRPTSRGTMGLASTNPSNPGSSILPSSAIRRNGSDTTAPTIMIAEKAAEMIRTGETF